MASALARLGRRGATRLAPLLRARPDFLIIGAQKAGTTSLHAYLAQHPRLRPARGRKELHYFNLYHHRGLGWYLSHFPYRAARGGRLLYEATPDYLCHPVVPGRVHAALGPIPLIAVLREPSARAYSAWKMWHAFAARDDAKAAKADPRSFAQAIADELGAPEAADRAHFHYVRMGRYAEHLRLWRETFGAARILVLDHAELDRDPARALGRICDHLDVAPFDAAAVARIARDRHWVGASREPTPEETATMARLRRHYAPVNETLFADIGRRFDWPTA